MEQTRDEEGEDRLREIKRGEVRDKKILAEVHEFMYEIRCESCGTHWNGVSLKQLKEYAYWHVRADEERRKAPVPVVILICGDCGHNLPCREEHDGMRPSCECGRNYA